MKPSINPLNILVIEDNPADFFFIEGMLMSSNINIREIYRAERIADAYTLLQIHDIGLVFLDLSLPDSFGIDSFLHIKPLVQHVPVIILSGNTESTLALEALQQGAQDYLVKGEFKTDLLTRAIKYSMERKNAEEKILASEEKYRQMFYRNPFPAWIYDMESLKILEVNDAAIEKYGYEKTEFLELTIEDIRPAEDIPALRLSIANRHEAHESKGELWKHKKKNGEIILVEITFYKINYLGIASMQAQMNDITEKMLLEEELAEQQREKQHQITEAILEAQEKERKALGAELHDNINQILATAILYMSAGMPKDQSSSNDMIIKGKECVISAVEEIRKLSKRLISPLFTFMGLKQAIEGLTDDIRNVKKIDVRTELDELENAPIQETLKLNLYRIIQEQLNNILKYADASKVLVSIHVAKENITLFISDNGKGYDTSTPSNGVGMINILHRAELFNGTVEINSAPGKGCSLKVMVVQNAA